MNENSRQEHQKQVDFAVGMAAIDGGKLDNHWDCRYFFYHP